MSIGIGELQRNAAKYVARVRETGLPEAITSDGHFVAVLSPAPPEDLVEGWVTGSVSHLLALEDS